jgi:hypothetical protein
MSWAQLTNPGLAYSPDDSSFYGTDAPTGTKAGGGIKYFKSKAARAKAFADAAALTAQPSPETVTGQFATPSDVQQTGVTLPDAAPSGVGPLAPSQAQPGPDFGPGPQQPDPTQSSFTSPAISPAAPKFLQPSFAQTLTDANGMPTPLNPAQTKLGKLASLLLSLGKGAMAGRAANEQMLAASGGRRSGGFGVGFEAAEREPYEEASMQQGVERSALQNQTERSQLAMMPWQWQQRGQLNAADIAEKQAQAKAAQAHANYWSSYAGQRDQLSLPSLHAQAVQQAIEAGRDPATDSKVQGYETAMANAQKEQRDPVAQRQDFANGNPGMFNDADEKKNFVLYGHDPDAKQANPTEWSLRVAASQGDPKAQQALNSYLADQKSLSDDRADARATAQDTKEQRGADAEQVASKILGAAGGDPDKTLKLFDQHSGSVTDPYQQRLGPAIRKAIRARRQINKAQSPIDRILSGDVEGGLNELQPSQ